MDISLRKLEQIVAVADMGSISAAAEHLNMTQPTLSRNVAAIEKYYGFRLFNRVGHGVTATSAGAQALGEARSLLRRTRIFNGNLKLFGSAQVGEVAVGFGPQLASLCLSQLICQLLRDSPKARLRSMINSPTDLHRELREDGIEMFFCPDTLIAPDTEIEALPLGKLKTIYAVRSAHPLAGRTGIAMQEIDRYPWASAVDVPLGSSEGLAKVKKAAFVCDNYHIVRNAVLESDLIWPCSATFVADDIACGLLKAVEFENITLQSSRVVMVKLRDRTLSPIAKRVMKYMTAFIG